MKRWMGPALMAAGLMALPAPAAADQLLSSAAGNWTGDGTLRTSSEGAPEPVRCRVDNSFNEANGQLSMSGRCAVPSQTWTVSGSLARDASGRYSGDWRDPRSGAMSAISGRRQGDSILFDITEQDPETGEDVDGSMVWTFRQGQYSIQSFVEANGERVAIATIVFSQ
ncbi:MAG: hypothetical protein ACFB01_08810 [Cohaesibacteraceae bacterium]